MGLTPQERQAFDQLTDTLRDEGVVDGIRKLRRRAVVYTFGAIACIAGILVPLIIDQPALAIPIFAGAVFCSLRALDAWGRIQRWDRGTPVEQPGLLRRFMGL